MCCVSYEAEVVISHLGRFSFLLGSEFEGRPFTKHSKIAFWACHSSESIKSSNRAFSFGENWRQESLTGWLLRRIRDSVQISTISAGAILSRNTLARRAR